MNKSDTEAMGLPEGRGRDGEAAILYPQAAAEAFTVEGRDPGPDLAPFVQSYWITRWDRRGLAPFVQRVLPSPSVNLTIKRAVPGWRD